MTKFMIMSILLLSTSVASASQRRYGFSPSAHPSYPDNPAAPRLTDGVSGTNFASGYVAWLGTQPVKIIVDLNSQTSISSARLHTISQNQYGIFYPTSIQVSTSSSWSGTVSSSDCTPSGGWTSFGTAGALPPDTQTISEDWVTVAGQATAEFVCFTVTPYAASWGTLFIDELDVQAGSTAPSSGLTGTFLAALSFFFQPALDAAYGFSPAAHPSYPDSPSPSKLTDGISGSDFTSGYVGWTGTQPVKMIVDLRYAAPISYARLHTISQTQYGIFFPTSIQVSTKNTWNGISPSDCTASGGWAAFGTAPALPANTSTASEHWVTVQGQATAQYVCFTVTPYFAPWGTLFVDELEARQESRDLVNQNLAELDSLGQRLVVVSALGEYDHCGNSPTHSGYTTCTRPRRILINEQISWLLQSAASHNMRIILALYNSPANDIYVDSAARSAFLAQNRKLVQDIEGDPALNHSPALFGYYIVQEPVVAPPASWGDPTSGGFFADAIGDIKQLSTRWTALAPYLCLNPVICFNIPKRTVDEVRDWTRVFLHGDPARGYRGCEADSLIIQDGVGSWDTHTADLAAYFQAAKEGAAPKQIWDDIEIFDYRSELNRSDLGPTSTWYYPTSISRLAAQIQAANQASIPEKLTFINQTHLTRLQADGPYFNYAKEARHLYRGYRAKYFDHLMYDGPNVTYSYSTPPNSSYPDWTGRMLLDGYVSQSGSANGWEGWVAWQSPVDETVSITVDLGTASPVNVSDVTAVVRSDTPGGIYFPSMMNVQYSVNGTDFFDLGSTMPLWDNSSLGVDMPVIVSANAPVMARKVRLNVSHSAWRILFLTEIEVYGSQ